MHKNIKISYIISYDISHDNKIYIILSRMIALARDMVTWLSCDHMKA